MDGTDAVRSETPSEPGRTAGPGARSRLIAVTALVVGALALIVGGLMALRGDDGDAPPDEVAVADVPASSAGSTSTSTPVDTTPAAVPDAPPETTTPASPTSVPSPLPPMPALPGPDLDETTTTTGWVLRFQVCAVPPVGSPVSSLFPEALGSDLPCKTAGGVSFGGINALSPPQFSMDDISQYSPDFIFATAMDDVIVGWMTKADQWSHREIDGWRIPLYDSDFTTRNGWLVGGAGIDLHFEPI
jgi:hypothetical protein